MEDTVFKVVKQGRHGMSRAAIMKQLGIDPAEEHARGDVWRVVAALAGLRHKGIVRSSPDRGETRYYATVA